jgi:hypothetical protein
MEHHRDHLPPDGDDGTPSRPTPPDDDDGEHDDG